MKRSIEPCGQFKAEPGAEVVAHSLCQTCGWNAYQHLSWSTDPDGTPGPDQQDLIDTGSQNVVGYQKRTEAELATVNRVKRFEQTVAAWLQETYFAAGVSLDPRQVASARTHFEYAFYHLNRAVFQPADPIGDVVKEGPR
jgi:hypothetical protein